MFSNFKSIIANYFLARDIRYLNIREKKLITLSEANSVGVLFDADSSGDLSVVKSFVKFLLKKNIDVYVLGFVDDSKMKTIHLSSIHIDYFNLSDLTFFGFPNSPKTNIFLSKKYDILVNLSLKNSFPTRCLSLKAKATFKIGSLIDKFSFGYDLMLNIKVKFLQYFVQNVTYYLELIDKNNAK